MDDGPNPLAKQILPTLSILILGVGLLALFLGYGWFWMVFVFGYAVVLPLVAILSQSIPGRGRRRERHDERNYDSRIDQSVESDGRQDALDTLRDRYARGEIDEEEFERRVDMLLENETVDDVKVRREREREFN